MAFLCVSQQGEFKNTKKRFWENPCQKLLAEKVEKKKRILSSFPMAFLCVSQQGDFKNTIKKLFGESPCQKLLAEKVEKTKRFSCLLFPSIFFIAFLAFSLHEEPKNTIKIFSKIRPENRKKSKKVGR
jgi:hypothetical protein